jgi:translation initiation factor IF-2
MGMTEKHKEAVRRKRPKLEIVLKCDSMGSLEAVTAAISEMTLEFDISIVHSGIGGISKSDVLFAETAGSLIVGFQVDALPGMDKILRAHGVEVRLYGVIYQLTADLRAIAESMIPPESQEDIIGSAKVIALFKSSRKGIIIGCEIQEGFLARGERFRIISAMGPVYSGTLESLHIRENAVQKATRGQQAGIKISDFNKVRIGDLVECYRPLPLKGSPWKPKGQIIRK